jgi:hypothetical protein
MSWQLCGGNNLNHRKSDYLDFLASALTDHEKKLNNLVFRLDKEISNLNNFSIPKSGGKKQKLTVSLKNDAEQNIFSVKSNSKVSSLFFDSAERQLNFTLEGTEEKTGFVDVYIVKTLVDNMNNSKVYLDGNKLDYSIEEQDNTWLLHFTYPHSKHKIEIHFCVPSKE